MSEQKVTGHRHRASCLCGCQFVEGVEGIVIETTPILDDGSEYVVTEFDLPRFKQKVAYRLDELETMEPSECRAPVAAEDLPL